MRTARHTASSRHSFWFEGELGGAAATSAGSALHYREDAAASPARSRRDLDDLIAEGRMWG